MRLTEIRPGHVLLRHRAAARWVLLGMAAVLATVAVLAAFRLGFGAAPLLAVLLGLLLAVGGFVCARGFWELEFAPDRVVWRRRGPFARRADERRFDRACVQAIELRPERERDGHGPPVYYAVDLVGRAPMPEAIALFDSIGRRRARRFAEALSSAIGAPLLDRVRG